MDGPGESDPRLLDALRRLVDGLLDPAALVDGRGRMLHCNMGYVACTGESPRKVRRAIAEGRACSDISPFGQCGGECPSKLALRHGRPVRVDEHRATRRDGLEMILNITAAPLADGLVVETFRDVTGESRMQHRYREMLARERESQERLERTVAERTADLRRAEELLALQEKLSGLGRLVAGVAHELANPINFITGNLPFLGEYFTQVLGLAALYERGQVDEATRAEAGRYKREVDYDFLASDWRRVLAAVRSGAQRCAAIVAELRAFSRPQSGALEEVDLLAGLELTLALVDTIRPPGVAIERRCSALPRISCRAGRIQQVVLNLLTNAVQACGARGRVSITAAVEDGGVAIRVRDTGQGIPEELRARIFDPFFTTKPVGEGTGLGLAISSDIAREHGGRLELVSPPGEGAEFLLWLPLRTGG